MSHKVVLLFAFSAKSSHRYWDRSRPRAAWIQTFRIWRCVVQTSVCLITLNRLVTFVYTIHSASMNPLKDYRSDVDDLCRLDDNSRYKSRLPALIRFIMLSYRHWWPFICLLISTSKTCESPQYGYTYVWAKAYFPWEEDIRGSKGCGIT